MEFIITGLIVVIIGICVFLVYKDGKRKKTKLIEKVSAGDTKMHVECVGRGPDGKHFDGNSLLIANDEILDDNHVIRQVEGGCMAPYNIKDGDYVVIELFEKNVVKENVIKEGDVLYIIYQDREKKPKHKIRVFSGTYSEDNKANTHYFLNNMERHDSSCPHSLDSIKGIVRYKIPDDVN